MSDCIFCRIVAGNLPCWKVWEDALVLAFLDINPVAEGHTLVIPKAHARDITGMTREDLAAVTAALARIAPVVTDLVGAEGFNLLNNCGCVAGQVVEHVHFHIIPRKEADGRGYRWITSTYPEGRGDQLAARIAGALS
ncbi:MAG: HIT family protein [Planctomycetes bacterium]|nr:HIT family protein [Planctomycetota bacterium]